MKLSSIFPEEHILVHPPQESVDGILRALVEAMRNQLGRLSPGEVADRVIARETAHPTVVEEQACLAHLRIDGLPRFCAAIGIARRPVPHPTLPEQKVGVVFLLLAPQDQNTMMLQTMAAVSRLLDTQSFLQGIHQVKTSARIIKLIEESGIEIKRNLTAMDIMEPIGHHVELDTPIAQAVDVLARARDEGVPVVDERGHLVGEITTREILLLGMPKYMDLLANPEMLNAFEPFENYFRSEGMTHVRDICRRDFVTVPPEELVVRVAHMMITANRRRVYVMDDDRMLGVIYRKSILERVMNH